MRWSARSSPGALEAPILLAEQNRVPAATLSAIAELGASRAILLGGEAALGPEVEVQLTSARLEVDRIAGDNRIQTAQAIVQVADSASDTVPGLVGTDRTALVASADGFPRRHWSAAHRPLAPDCHCSSSPPKGFPRGRRT